MDTIVAAMIEKTPEAIESLRSRTSPLRVATDCSGIDAPIIALDVLQIPYVHVFSSETDSRAREFLLKVHSPGTLYDDILTRTPADIEQHVPIDLYVAGPPCQQ